jgi:hypothetical protein
MHYYDINSNYGAFNYTGAFFWPFAEKITVASISMKNYQVVPFFIIFMFFIEQNFEGLLAKNMRKYPP